jgi:hypothetical protein
MDVLFPEDECHDDTDYHKNIRSNAMLPINTQDDLPFAEQEIKACFESQNKNKAPGIDNFPADVALNTFLTIPHEVRQIYNSCLEVGYYPKIWKTALLKLIKKNNGKKDSDPKSYRPISLLCVFAKVLEKILINRINYHFYSNNLINSSQFGFKSQSSTEDAILKIVNKVTERLNIKGFALLISLDFQGAFDTAWHPIIIEQLRRKNCPKNIFNTIRSYLKDRQIVYSDTEITVRRTLTRGAPQGSACCPGLWVTIYDSLLELELNEGAEIVGYADDTLLMVCANSTSRLARIANSALNLINEWSHKNKLQFNAMKTEMVLITRKINFTFPQIHFNSTLIPYKTHIKYLGVIIDQKLNWNRHIDYMIGKALRAINNISAITRNLWGLKSHDLRTIYIGAIEPILLYAASIWSPAIHKKFIQLKLNRTQRLIAIRIIKGYRTISCDAAVLLAGLIPIKYRIMEVSNLYKLKKN